MNQQSIKQLIQDTQAIAEEVRLNNWSVVQVMAEKRQQALQDFFAQPVSSEDAEDVAAMIHKIMSLDDQVMQQIMAEKEATISSFKTLNKQSKAHQSYHNVATFSAG